MGVAHPRNTSSAYDLSMFEERAERRTLRVVKNRASLTNGLLLGTTPLAVVCVAAIVVAVMALFIYNNVIINELSAQVNQISAELSELENENVLLQASLESKMSAKNIQESAEQSLGLVKMDRNQIHYINLAPDDVVEVNGETNILSGETKTQEKGLLEQLVDRVKAYFS